MEEKKVKFEVEVTKFKFKFKVKKSGDEDETIKKHTQGSNEQDAHLRLLKTHFEMELMFLVNIY